MTQYATGGIFLGDVDTSTEQRTPAEWCEHYGMEVADADGWRHDGKSWTEPITLGEFAERAATSTIVFPHYLRSKQYG